MAIGRKAWRRAGLTLLVVVVLIQFVRPGKNLSVNITNDITTKYPMPDTVLQIMKVACYDCHSNSTRYPWYSNFQPVVWWLQNHVNDGKRHLNFSEFATYSPARQYNKLEEVNKAVKEGWMPLSSYTIIHKDAILTEEQKLLIAEWTVSLRDSLKATYPPDSLIMPKRPKKN